MTATPTNHKKTESLSPNLFRKRIKKAYEEVKQFIEKNKNERFLKLWPEWDQRFHAIHKQSKTRPEVAISMIGGTGAGKSTLLNALIGARVLPISNMRACTAAISEVAYLDGPYRAKVEFISRDSWEKEIHLLQEEYQDSRDIGGSSDINDPQLSISRAALDKIWSVYKPSDDADKKDFDPFNLVEPPVVQKALDIGYMEVETPSIKEFRKKISYFLDSKHRFWPLVKTVAIQGPFESLKDGAKLIDLPGVNDPNEAREEITRTHLKTCRFVWIVFNIKRALTKDTMNLMQSDDFLRQIVMDGRADSLTFVGTASDDIDIESGIEEFELDEDAEIVEIISARNQAVRNVVSDQLDDLALKLARLGNEDPQVAQKLAIKLKGSNILTVSAREYLRLNNLARTNPSGLDDVNETEIPELIKHMQSVCSNYGVEAHISSLNRQLNLLFSEIKQEIKSQKATLENQEKVTEKQRKELGAAVDTARSFLSRDLKDSQERLTQDLESSQSLLSERIKRAVDRARIELEETTVRQWARTHHGTIKAVCRRGGIYVGSTGRNDFAADLCKPILNGIAFAWSDFFGDKLGQIMEKWTARLRRNSDDFRSKMIKTLGRTPDLPDSVFKSISDVFDTTEKVLDELLAQITNEMNNKITEKQRTLYEKVPDQVKANMLTAFERAAQEKGSGMKQRMIETLSSHAHDVSDVMFDDARDTLLKGVRSLNNWLVSEYDKMIDSISRNAEMVSENLVAGESQLSVERIAAQMKILNELEEMIANQCP